VSSNMNGDDDDDDSNIGTLGSGSDYTVFLDHFGIPSLDFSYNKKKATYGQYHSIYDSFAWMDKFGGSTQGSSFELMAFAAKIWGLLGTYALFFVFIHSKPVLCILQVFISQQRAL